MTETPATTTTPEVPVPPAAPADGAAPPAAKPEEPRPIASGQFKALAQKEKAIFRRAQELAEKEKAAAEREAKLVALEARRGEYKLNPLKALEDAGLSFEEITQFVLNKEKPTANAQVEKLRMDLEALKNQTAEERKKAEQAAIDAAKQREAEAISEFQSQIHSFVESNKEEFDLIHLLGAEGLIWTGIEQTYQATGKIPTIKEAAQGVMEYLQKQVDEIIPKTKWWNTKTAKPAQDQKESAPAGKEAQTITNDMSAPTTNLPAITEAERVKRALAALG